MTIAPFTYDGAHIKTFVSVSDADHVIEKMLMFIENKSLNQQQRRRRQVSDLASIQSATIITYESKDFLCQVTLFGDDHHSFMAMEYKRASELITAKVTNKDPMCPDQFILSNQNATHTSNVGLAGVFVVDLNENCSQPANRTG